MHNYHSIYAMDHRLWAMDFKKNASIAAQKAVLLKAKKACD